MAETFTNKDKIQIWREAMTQLRHLSDDVWNGLKLFLSLNGLILVSVVLVCSFRYSSRRTAAVILFLSVTGIILTLVARYILKRHRIYYLQMLAKKSLMETELGFYETKLCGSETDLAFPWRLTPQVVAEIKTNSEAWVQKSIRAPGTIARFQFLIYDTLIGLHCVLLLATLAGLLR